MKKWLVPLAVLAILVAGATTATFVVGRGGPTVQGDTVPRSDEDIDPGECSLVHNINACSPEEIEQGFPDGGAVAGMCAEGFEDCEDTIVIGDDPISGRCADAPDAPECVAEEPPLDPAPSPGTVAYDVSIAFDESVTQADMDLAAEIVRSIDRDAEFLIQESFPPVGRASVTTNDGEACASLEEQLSDLPGVGDVTCSPAQQQPVDDPDVPVSSN